MSGWLLRLAILLPLLGTSMAEAWAAGSATTTSLAISSGGAASTTITAGTVVTLTAAVTAGTVPVTVGQVKFCDASATYCEDVHVVGIAQLTSAGTAVFKFRPGVGSHSYKALFLGTTTYAASASAASGLTVTGPSVSSTVIAQSGSGGTYSLTATVGGWASAAPSGTVSFLDTSNGNASLVTATLGNGTSGLTFLNSSNPPAGNIPIRVAVADFNGDGIPDLAVTDFNYNCDPSCVAGPGMVTVLLGNGNGTFTAVPVSPVTDQYPIGIAAGDFNGDGIPDLAVANLGSSTGSLTILIGKGDGTFTVMPNSPALGNASEQIFAVDFNGDGYLDLAVGDQAAPTIFLGNGDGTFAKAPAPPALYSSPMAVGDFNGDGVPDLVVANSNALTVLLGNGDGTFTPLNSFNFSSPYFIAAADFNGDGKLDLAVGEYPIGVIVLLGNGDGTFTSTPANTAGGTAPERIVVGDFNGDGIPDLAVANGFSTVTILTGQGDGTFTSQASPLLDFGANLLGVGDFNGDGYQDLVSQPASGGNTAQVWLAEDQTASTPATSITIPGVGVYTWLKRIISETAPITPVSPTRPCCTRSSRSHSS